MRVDRLPLTYDECRARFRRTATEAGLPVRSDAITARGPDGQTLTIDSVWFGRRGELTAGDDRPRRALTILSGVHGVEGFVNSALQCDLLARVGSAEGRATLPDDVGVQLVHAVNPWGMAWWRRQNESNVDLNRNWRRSEIEPMHNDAYDEIHHLACPDTPGLPSLDDLLVAAAGYVADKGLPWVRDAITIGQYRHPDGLHYGGERTEESNAILQQLVTERLVGAERALTIDLHTGHGPRGALTLLSDQPIGSAQHEFFTTRFPEARVEATADNPDATTGLKSGQIANGFDDLLAGAPGFVEHFATSAEWGTASDEEQLAATYLESWVARHGDRANPEHAAVVWQYRCCFTPDDPEWEATCLATGRRFLDEALGAICTWT